MSRTYIVSMRTHCETFNSICCIRNRIRDLTYAQKHFVGSPFKWPNAEQRNVSKNASKYAQTQHIWIDSKTKENEWENIQTHAQIESWNLESAHNRMLCEQRAAIKWCFFLGIPFCFVRSFFSVSFFCYLFNWRALRYTLTQAKGDLSTLARTHARMFFFALKIC